MTDEKRKQLPTRSDVMESIATLVAALVTLDAWALAPEWALAQALSVPYFLRDQSDTKDVVAAVAVYRQKVDELQSQPRDSATAAEVADGRARAHAMAWVSMALPDRAAILCSDYLLSRANRRALVALSDAPKRAQLAAFLALPEAAQESIMGDAAPPPHGLAQCVAHAAEVIHTAATTLDE